MRRSGRAPSLGRMAPLLAVGLVAVLFAAHVDRFDFITDDAFISFRYARNFADGYGFVFNPGERVEGYTNFLWTLLLGLGMKAGIDPVGLARFLGLVSGLATLVVLAWFSARRRNRASLYDAMAPLLVALSPAFACWCSGGLETPLFTFLITLGWATYLAQGGHPGRGSRGSLRLAAVAGLGFGLAATTRPEGVLVFAVVAGHRALECVLARARDAVGSTPSRMDSHRDAARGPGVADFATVTTFLAVFVPYFAWRWTYYGWFFPNTYYVKASTTYWSQGLAYLGSFAADHLLWVLPILILVQLAISRRVPAREWSLLVGLVAALAIHVARIGGDFMALSRFLVPLVPVLGWVVAAALETLHCAAARSPAQKTAAVVVALGVAGAVAYNAYLVGTHALEVWHDRRTGIDSIGVLQMYSRNWSRVGRWLGKNYARDTKIAVDAAGAIPYYSSLPSLDTLGLCDEYIAHEVPATRVRPGHSKRAPTDYILQRNIDLLIFHPRLGRRRVRPPPNTKQWSQHGYRWRSVRIAEKGRKDIWFGFWQRRRDQ